MTYDTWKTATPPEYEASTAATCDICHQATESAETLSLCVRCATKPRASQRFSIEQMREAVSMFGDCNESFNERFNVEQLMALWDMRAKSGWLFYPDEWTQRQVNEALQGKPPQWDKDENPVYDEVG